MKKISSALLAMIAALAFACKQPDTPNDNRNAANVNAAGDPGNQNAGSPQEGFGLEKSVTITIADETGSKDKCTITVDPDSIHLSKGNQHKIKWCIVNNSQSASGATVTIGGFTSQANPDKKNPFGDGSDSDNTFDISSDDYNCRKKTKDAAKGEAGIAYKYTITAKVNNSAKCILDPQVVIDN